MSPPFAVAWRQVFGVQAELAHRVSVPAHLLQPGREITPGEPFGDNAAGFARQADLCELSWPPLTRPAQAASCRLRAPGECCPVHVLRATPAHAMPRTGWSPEVMVVP